MALDENPVWLQFGIKNLESIDRDVLLLALEISKLPKPLHEHIWALVDSFKQDHPEKPSRHRSSDT